MSRMSQAACRDFTTVGSFSAIRPSLSLAMALLKLVADAIPIRLGQRCWGATADRLQKLLPNCAAVVLSLLKLPDHGPHVFAGGAKTLLESLLMEKRLHRFGHSDMQCGHRTVPPQWQEHTIGLGIQLASGVVSSRSKATGFRIKRWG